MFERKKSLERTKRRKEFNVKQGIRGIGLKMWTEFTHSWMGLILKEVCSHIHINLVITLCERNVALHKVTTGLEKG